MIKVLIRLYPKILCYGQIIIKMAGMREKGYGKNVSMMERKKLTNEGIEW